MFDYDSMRRKLESGALSISVGQVTIDMTWLAIVVYPEPFNLYEQCKLDQNELKLVSDSQNSTPTSSY